LIVGAPRNYSAVLPDKNANATIASELQLAVRQLANEHASR